MLNEIWEVDYYRTDLKLDFTIKENCDYSIEAIKIYILYIRYTNFNKDDFHTKKVHGRFDIADYFNTEELIYIRNVYYNTDRDYNQFVSYFIYNLYFYAKKSKKHKHIENVFLARDLHLIHSNNANEFIRNFYSNKKQVSKLLKNKNNYIGFIKDSLIIMGDKSRQKYFEEYLTIFDFVYKEKLIPIYNLPLYDYKISTSIAIEEYKNYILELAKGYSFVDDTKCIEILFNENVFDDNFHVEILKKIDQNVELLLIGEENKIFNKEHLSNIISLLRVIISTSSQLSNEIKDEYKRKLLEIESHKRNAIKEMNNCEWQSMQSAVPSYYVRIIERGIQSDFYTTFINIFAVKFPDEIKKTINTQGELSLFAMANKQEVDIENYQAKNISELIKTAPKTVIENYLNDCSLEYLNNPDVELINAHTLYSFNLSVLVYYYTRRRLANRICVFYNAFKNVHPQLELVDFIEECLVNKSVFKDKLIGKSSYGIVISNVIECEKVLLSIYNKIFGKHAHYFIFVYIEEIFEYYLDTSTTITEFENIVLNIVFVLYADSGLNLRNDYCHGNKVFNKEIDFDICDIIYSYIGVILCNSLKRICEDSNYDK